MLQLLNWSENNGSGKQNFLTCTYQCYIFRKLVWCKHLNKLTWLNVHFSFKAGRHMMDIILWADLTSAPHVFHVKKLKSSERIPPPFFSGGFQSRDLKENCPWVYWNQFIPRIYYSLAPVSMVAKEASLIPFLTTFKLPHCSKIQSSSLFMSHKAHNVLFSP